MPPLHAEPSLGGVYLVFWWRGIPLGSCEIPAAMLSMSAFQLADHAVRAIAPAVGARSREVGFSASLPERGARAPSVADLKLRELKLLDGTMSDLLRQLGGIEERHVEDASVSVVVCTKNRPAELERCLRSLRALSDQPREILVVDNDPGSPGTRDVVSRFAGVCYVPEPLPGLSKARNRGIRHCSGEIIAFTDDDCQVQHGWIQGLLGAFKDPRTLAVTGLVLPARLETEAEYQFQHGLNRYGWGYCPLTFDEAYFQRTVARGTPVWHIGAGANMAFRREVFNRLGYFDERLGAGASGCSEDSEMWYRILATGWRCRYEPQAVVHHYHRHTEKLLKEQSYQYMRGHMAALLIQFEKHRHWGNLYRAFGTLPHYYARLALRRVLNGAAPGLEMLNSQIRGYLAGVLFYLSNRAPQASQ